MSQERKWQLIGINTCIGLLQEKMTEILILIKQFWAKDTTSTCHQPIHNGYGVMGIQS